MTTLERLRSIQYHLTTFVAPGSDDPSSVAYITDQLAKAISELTAANNAEIRRTLRRQRLETGDPR